MDGEGVCNIYFKKRTDDLGLGEHGPRDDVRRLRLAHARRARERCVGKCVCVNVYVRDMRVYTCNDSIDEGACTCTCVRTEHERVGLFAHEGHLPVAQPRRDHAQRPADAGVCKNRVGGRTTKTKIKINPSTATSIDPSITNSDVR